MSYSWPFRHHCSPFSNTYSASGRLSEGESMESLTSLHSAQAHSHTSPNSHHRSSLTHNKLIMHRDAQGSRLNRSNSIRWVPIYIGVYLQFVKLWQRCKGFRSCQMEVSQVFPKLYVYLLYFIYIISTHNHVVQKKFYTQKYIDKSS